MKTARKRPGKSIGWSLPKRLDLRTPAARHLLDDLRDQSRPAGLVVGAQARAGFAVEVFVEEEVVAEKGIGLRDLAAVEAGAAALGVGEEDAGEAAADFDGDLVEGHLLAGAGGALELEHVAVEAVVDAQGGDEHEGGGQPDGPAPVAVAAEHAGAGFGGLVADRPLAV